MKGPANQVKYRRKPAAAGNLQKQIPEPLHRLSLVGGKGLRRSPVNRERPVHTVCRDSCFQNAPPKSGILRCHVRHVKQGLIQLPGIEHDGRGENHRPAQRMAKIKLLRNMDHASRSLRIRIPKFIGGKNKRRVLLPKEQQLKLLGEIQEDSEWLIRMVENLLSVTRIDGAKVEVAKTPTVLDELIDSVLMKFSKKHPNQKVITQIPDEFVDIPMDSLLIEQVLLNLLENAVFHAKGMTELTLSVSLVGDKAVFEVADNGCGIPEDALQKIFTGGCEKSAVPVDGTRRNMGIGLSVCAAIVKAHGSDITAENRRGGGAVFRFALERGGEDDGQ